MATNTNLEIVQLKVKGFIGNDVIERKHCLEIESPGSVSLWQRYLHAFYNGISFPFPITFIKIFLNKTFPTL